MRLLVSVRSAAEAEAALAGGAALIDVKEPLHGPLGRADDEVLRAVIGMVAGRVPVSAARGELREEEGPLDLPVGLAFVKWGLAGTATADWRAALARRAERLARDGAGGPRPVVVAYADAERAGAPPVGDGVDFACRSGRALLVDTFDKSPPSGPRATLLDWLSVEEVTTLCQRCRAAGVWVALAGSLGPEEIRRLLPAEPDWFAVRAAACTGRDRQQAVSADRVRDLVRLLSVAGGLAAV